MLWVVLNFDEESLVCSTITKSLKVFTICRIITILLIFVKECVTSSMFLITRQKIVFLNRYVFCFNLIYVRAHNAFVNYFNYV